MRRPATPLLVLLLLTLLFSGCETASVETAESYPLTGPTGGELIQITPEMTLPVFRGEARGPKIEDSKEALPLKPLTGAVMKPNGVALIDEMDVLPTLRFQAMPAYPSVLYRGGIEGDVLLAFAVTAKGTVAHVMVAEASDERFAYAAIQAVKKWRFRPGKKSGQDAACLVAVPIAFRLADR